MDGNISVLVIERSNNIRVQIVRIVEENISTEIKEAQNIDYAIKQFSEPAFDLIICELAFLDKLKEWITTLSDKVYQKYKPKLLILLPVNPNFESLKDVTTSFRVDFIKKSIQPGEFEFSLIHNLSSLAGEIKLQKSEYELTIRLAETNNKLKASEARFQNIVHNAVAGILIIDKDGILRFLNTKASKIFRRNSADLLNKPFGLVKALDSKSEIEILLPNGSLGTGEVISSPIVWDGDEATLVLINDITKHKRLQERLRSAMENAKEADKLKTAFLANVSHEIRTPLNGIVGFAQLLTEEVSPEEVTQFASIIQESGDYLQKIMNDILDISLIESGQVRIQKKAFSADAVLKHVAASFQDMEHVKEKELIIKLELPHSEEIVLYNDPLRFRQVITNLLNNAVKFTNQGIISLGVMPDRSDRITFFVKDTGIGIAEEKQNQLFTRFVKSESIHNKLNQGLGLGLAISKELLNLMGGEIWFRSEENAGTEFYFNLPFKPDLDLQNPKQLNRNHSLSFLRNKKILVVEDEEINYMLIQNMFQHSGITILWAKTGQEAVDMVMDYSVDLILMDIKLPHMNGYEATRIIKSLKPEIPVIAQTAYAQDSDRLKCIEAGCSDYISKPLNFDELLAKVKNLVPVH